MTKETAAQFLPLVQALADGKVIQFRYQDSGWTDIPDPSFGFEIERWRIKPEPREFWLIRGSKKFQGSNGTYTAKQAWVPGDAEEIHVREVI